MSLETRNHKPSKEMPFFVGYFNNIPKGLFGFLVLVIVGFVGGMGAASFALSSNQQDPGSGDPGWGGGRQEIIGRLEFYPYPVLRVPAADGEPARTYLLAGMGKRGVYDRSQELEGLMVRAEGFVSSRAGVNMIQVVNSARGLQAADEYSPAAYFPEGPEKLGKWKITGEICDGKCYAGLMRPGTGLAHKACANLCLTDRVPAVFVSAAPFEGIDALLLADKNGGLYDLDEISPLVALYLTAEGQVERLDNLLVFKMDDETVRVRH